MPNSGSYFDTPVGLPKLADCASKLTNRALSCVAMFTTLLVVSACGGSGSGEGVNSGATDTPAARVSVSVTASGGVEKASTNLTDGSQQWSTWSGNPTQIYYDWDAGALRIPTNGQDLALAVQRYDRPLSAGTTYTLQVDSDDNGARALMFLFDSNGSVVRINGTDLVASKNAPATFVAPGNIAGFFLQVQNAWRANSDTLLNAQLSDGPSFDVDVSGTAIGTELVGLNGAWDNWSNEDTGVYHDSGAGHLVIPAPHSWESNRIGVQRFYAPLDAGTEYELTASSVSDAQASVILFLYNAAGQTFGFTDSSGTYRNWLTAAGSEKLRFYPPAGVSGFAIQVQSRYRASATTTIRPSLQPVVAGTGNGNTNNDGSDTDSGNTDSGNTDSGNTDSGNTDSGNTDSGSTDSANTGGNTAGGGNNGSSRPRVVVVTDANYSGGDPDDKQSLAHMMWYANELDIRGIVPQLWNGQGHTVAMESLNAYEQDYYAYGLSGKGFPTPQEIKNRVPYTQSAGIDLIIREADASSEPLYVLLWGEMTPVRDVLYKRPDLVSKLRLLSIASDRMADSGNCSRVNWNGGGRNDIFKDGRFNNLWWVESNWTYNGMFDGDRPRQILEQISGYGSLGWYQKQAVSGVSWAQYFRAGDTPTVLYLIDPNNNLENPSQGSWAGQFHRPFPGQRPNYYADSAGGLGWDYANPCNTWGLMNQVYNASKDTMARQRESMYSAMIGKLNWIYGR